MHRTRCSGWRWPQQWDSNVSTRSRCPSVNTSIANSCTNDIIAGGAGRSIAAVADTINGTALLDDPSIQAVFADNSVEALPSVPNAPIYEWHANDDVLIPVDAITSTMRRYCDAGVPVQSESVWSPDHLSAAVVGLPGAISFLTDRFAGVTPTSNC